MMSTHVEYEIPLLSQHYWDLPFRKGAGNGTGTRYRRGPMTPMMLLLQITGIVEEERQFYKYEILQRFFEGWILDS